MEEGLVCHRKTQRAERVKTEEKGGTGGPEILKRQCPSQWDRHGCGWSVRPTAWGSLRSFTVKWRPGSPGVTVSLCLCDYWMSPSAALTRKKRALEGATDLVSSGRWESKELAQRSRAGLVSWEPCHAQSPIFPGPVPGSISFSP